MWAAATTNAPCWPSGWPAQGDITGGEQVLWRRSRGTPYVPSPLLYGDVLYFLTHYQGILNRVDARTGEDRPGPLRLGGVTEVYASPVGAADRIYVTDRSGLTLVIEHSDTPLAVGGKPTRRYFQCLGCHRRRRTVSPRRKGPLLSGAGALVPLQISIDG